MIKAEEKFDQLSETESESSTDSQNPFNVYVQMYKKSTKTDMDVKLAQLNTRTSNQSTPEHSKAPNCQDLQFSQSSQNDFPSQSTEQIQSSLAESSEDPLVNLTKLFHIQANKIQEAQQDINYWSSKVLSLNLILKCQNLEVQLAIVSAHREDMRLQKRLQFQEELSKVKNDLKGLLAKTENLNKEISKQDETLEEVNFQKIEIEREIGQTMQELKDEQNSKEEKLRLKEEKEFEAAINFIYQNQDFNQLTGLAMKVQNEIQKKYAVSYQKTTDQSQTSK